MEVDYNFFLSLAIKEAWKYQLLTYPNPAVGAVVVDKNNNILSIEAHKNAGEPHAEVLALKSAYLKLFPQSNIAQLTNSFDIHNFLLRYHNDIFCDCFLYVTLEPCNHIGKTPSCANLIKNLKLKKVIIGTKDTNQLATGGINTLQNANINTILLDSKDALELLYPFAKWQKDRFHFFKLAIKPNGKCDGGYITTQDSLNLVHHIRTKLDLLIIGGNTVRIDRPTLDSRFNKINKPPNILIYSTQKDFDHTIPLFQVPNRKVTITNDISNIKEKFVMYEGGYNLLDKVYQNIDYFMLFVSHKDSSATSYSFDKYNFKKVYSYFLNKYDEIIFLNKQF
jgi:diaminohydroxyphosphoribosylaminopyrimidine deaminase/5-amino-6-(5-phosphoribosylamino)uracil reductase